MPQPKNVFCDNEKLLQAIVLADSFNERFMPVTLDRPRCLLPLVNIPIIEYTFEFLAISGVQEVILFCRAHSDQIRQYINKSRWAKPTSTMNINIIVNSECSSAGDALRDIDARSLIHGDFILVCGDVVSNINLSQALLEHKQRRQKDNNYIMTMILKESTPFHRSRERCESGVFAISNYTGECIAYEPVETESLKSVSMPLTKLNSIKELSIRYDLLDCQIDICSLNVLALYTENFDYDDIRKDFLRGVLTSDILGVKVATHILSDAYASRVRSPHLYDSISKDIIERWVYPVVPEADLLEEQPYSYRRGNFYLGVDTVISKSARLGNGVVLGNGVGIGENSSIKNSVIGMNCRIGSDVIIENSYIWDHSVIENGCKIFSSIIGDQVRIRTDTTINSGCIVAGNTTLGPRAEIPPHTRIAKLGEHIDLPLRQLRIGENEDITKVTESNKIYLGEGTDAVVWEGTIDEVEESDVFEDPLIQEERRDAFNMGSNFHKSRPTYSDPESEFEAEDIYEEEQNVSLHDDEDFSNYSNSFGRNSSKFLNDAYDLVKHAIESKYAIDNAILEINGLKFACNATFSECRQVIIKALFDYIDESTMAKSIDHLFLLWAPLISRFTQGIEEEIELVNIIQTTCRQNPTLEKSFQFIIPILYKTDVLEEDSIVKWFTANEQSNSIFVRQIKSFVQWLEQEDEEESSEE